MWNMFYVIMMNSSTCFVQFSSVFELEMREFGFTNPQNYFITAVLLDKLMDRDGDSVDQREWENLGITGISTFYTKLVSLVWFILWSKDHINSCSNNVPLKIFRIDYLSWVPKDLTHLDYKQEVIIDIVT